MLGKRYKVIIIGHLLKPFVVAFARMMVEGPSAEFNHEMSATLQTVRPWVFLIWLGLFVNAAIGLHLL